MRSCKSISVALLVAILVQVGYLTVKPLRLVYIPIASEINQSVSTYKTYETVVYCVIIALRITEYSVLLASMCKSLWEKELDI